MIQSLDEFQLNMYIVASYQNDRLPIQPIIVLKDSERRMKYNASKWNETWIGFPVDL